MVIRPLWHNEPCVSPACISSQCDWSASWKQYDMTSLKGYFIKGKQAGGREGAAWWGSIGPDSSDVTATGARICAAQMRLSSYNNCIIATVKVSDRHESLHQTVSLPFAVIQEIKMKPWCNSSYFKGNIIASQCLEKSTWLISNNVINKELRNPEN